MSMTDADEHSDRDSSATGNQSARNWMAKNIAWMPKSSGETLGHSVRAMKKTGAMVAGAQRAATQIIKASGKAGDALLVSTAGRLPVQIAIGNRIRMRKRIRRLQKQNIHLKRKMELKVAAALAAGQTKLAESVEVRKLSQAVRQRAVEIAELKDRLKTPLTKATVQAISKGPKRKTQAAAATRAAAPESAVTAEAPANESPVRELPEVEGSAVECPAAEPLEAEAPVVEETVTEPPEAEAPVVEETVAEPPEAEAPVVEEVVAEPPKTEEPVVEEPVAIAHKAKGVPSTADQVRFSLERAAEQAEFRLASERLAFQRAVREVQNADPALTDVAMENLKQIRNPAVTRVLGLLANDPRARVRARALTTLTERQDKRAMLLFQQAVNDSSARVRMATLRGLYKLDCETAVPYLVKALEDEDAGVRRRAVTCLAWAGVQEAVPNLLLLLRDPDPGVRKAVVDSLGNLKSELAVPDLIQALDDEDVRVRQAADKTLKNLTHRTISFNPEASREDRGKIKARWDAWWRANRATFRVG